MPPGGPNSRYVGAETAIDSSGRKWVLSLRPPRRRDFTGQVYIVVQDGQTLDSIAHRRFAEWRHWQILAQMNDVIDPTQTPEGGSTIVAPPATQIGDIVGDRSAAR